MRDPFCFPNRSCEGIHFAVMNPQASRPNRNTRQLLQLRWERRRTMAAALGGPTDTVSERADYCRSDLHPARM